MTELQEKIARLPAWARVHIKELERINAPAVAEVSRVRQELLTAKDKSRRLQASNEALLEILRRAGETHDWSKKVVDILDGYEIFREKTEE
jgi:hypothetical protein